MNFSEKTIYGALWKCLTWWQEHELRIIARQIMKKTGLIVQTGPFKGLKFPLGIHVWENTPKLLGSYERELHHLVEALIEQHFQRVINIGCAEGYYAVGLALRMPTATVYAFEADAEYRAVCAATAVLNDVAERVLLHGFCNAGDLAKLHVENALIVCDCEGYEAEIFPEPLADRYHSTWMLVELHESLRPGCSRTLWQRFANTHEMVFVSAQERDQSAWPSLSKLGKHRARLALWERRLGVQEWVLMKPKTATDQNQQVPVKDSPAGHANSA